MIKFFNKIRQHPLTENKFSKYLIYAIGEIILVVIGILIALQINNWNEERKVKSLQIKILRDLAYDVQENISNLNEGIKMLKMATADNAKVLLMCEQKTPYNDSLKPAFTYFLNQWDPDFTYAAFENLKSLGFNIISNPVLRKRIINLTEVEMNMLDNSDMSRISQMNSVMILPLIKKYFFRDLNYNRAISLTHENFPLVPSNYQAMINDQEFYNVCTEAAFRQERSMIRFHNFNKNATKLVSEIESEIRLLE